MYISDFGWRCSNGLFLWPCSSAHLSFLFFFFHLPSHVWFHYLDLVRPSISTFTSLRRGRESSRRVRYAGCVTRCDNDTRLTASAGIQFSGFRIRLGFRTKSVILVSRNLWYVLDEKILILWERWMFDEWVLVIIYYRDNFVNL